MPLKPSDEVILSLQLVWLKPITRAPCHQRKILRISQLPASNDSDKPLHLNHLEGYL